MSIFSKTVRSQMSSFRIKNVSGNEKEVKRNAIYIYTMISFCDRDRRCDPNQHVFVYDSG
jgi:hypothetical protein